MIKRFYSCRKIPFSYNSNLEQLQAALTVNQQITCLFCNKAIETQPVPFSANSTIMVNRIACWHCEWYVDFADNIVIDDRWFGWIGWIGVNHPPQNLQFGSLWLQKKIEFATLAELLNKIILLSYVENNR